MRASVRTARDNRPHSILVTSDLRTPPRRAAISQPRGRSLPVTPPAGTTPHVRGGGARRVPVDVEHPAGARRRVSTRRCAGLALVAQVCASDPGRKPDRVASTHHRGAGKSSRALRCKLAIGFVAKHSSPGGDSRSCLRRHCDGAPAGGRTIKAIAGTHAAGHPESGRREKSAAGAADSCLHAIGTVTTIAPIACWEPHRSEPANVRDAC